MFNIILFSEKIMLEKEGSVSSKVKRIKNQTEPIPFIPGKMKLEDYLAMAPESKCDLIDGNYIHHSPASYKHNRLRGFFESVIRFFVEKNNLGEVISENFPVKLNESNWREPDLAIISKERLKDLKDTIFIGIPNFVIEIISENSRYRDEVRKRAEYERLGVDEYWIIDPNSFEHSTFLRKSGDRFEAIQFLDDKIESTIITGLFFKIEWIWSGEELPTLEFIFKELNLI